MKSLIAIFSVSLLLSVLVTSCTRDNRNDTNVSNVKQDKEVLDWKTLLLAQHDITSEGSDEFQLLTGDPASNAAIDTLEQKFGVTFPEEFRSFYSEFDGYGTQYEKNGVVENDWLILPTERITLFSRNGEWESDVHQDAAERLLVIVDFGTGDCAGYKLAHSGEIVSSKLYIFDHERIDFTPDQKVDEFIFEYWDGIEGFLKDHKWAW